MNADFFYEEFKAALKFLGLEWGQKELATVTVADGCLVITYKYLSVRIAIGA